MDEATIASIATSMSDAGIGIIRISGKDAISCAEAVLEYPIADREKNTIRFNRVKIAKDALSDEALVSVMRAPHSYTGEDVVEINTHGGRYVMECVLENLLRKECSRIRLAQPGEFTKRAFLNGKMDLTKAEAVQDLIGAKNDFALNNAARQLRGALAGIVSGMREKLLHEAAFIEAALDDPDVYEAELEGYGDRLKSVVTDALGQMDHLADSFEEGALRKDGIRCAILGKPNTGKSTLLNLLAGEERAIVTDIPGTTRDVIEETVRLDDLLLRVMDTAGIRSPGDEAEKIGIERAKMRAEEADLILLVIDATDRADMQLLEMIQKKKTVVLFNKTDLSDEEAITRTEETYRRWLLDSSDDGSGRPFSPVWIRTSLKEGKGTDRLKDVLKDLFFRGELCAKEEYYLTNARHKEAVEAARKSLQCVLLAVNEGASEELFQPDLMDAYTALGTITGETVEEDLLDKIFSEFCMGK